MTYMHTHTTYYAVNFWGVVQGMGLAGEQGDGHRRGRGCELNSLGYQIMTKVDHGGGGRAYIYIYIYIYMFVSKVDQEGVATNIEK